MKLHMLKSKIHNAIVTGTDTRYEGSIVVDAALIGADICTIPFSVMAKLVQHPLTDIGIERFLKDWGKVKK